MARQGIGLMSKIRGIFAAAVMVSVLAGSVHGDLMPIPVAEAGMEQSVSVSAPPEVDSQAASEPYLVLPGAFDLPSGHLGLLVDAALAEAAEPPNVLILTDRSNSFSLCLYALIGLGVFRSAHSIRKPSLGFMPEWYHAGGPHQLGHRHALGPDAVCHARLCFVQPERRPLGLLPQYRRGMMAPLLRISQCTPTVLASRGPPDLAFDSSADA